MPTTSTAGGVQGDAREVACWCCAWRGRESGVVRLGSHPDVAICLRCAHWLHQQARIREDAGRASLAAGIRDGLRAGRWVVISRGWHQKPVIGPALRWPGPRLP